MAQNILYTPLVLLDVHRDANLEKSAVAETTAALRAHSNIFFSRTTHLRRKQTWSSGVSILRAYIIKKQEWTKNGRVHACSFSRGITLLLLFMFLFVPEMICWIGNLYEPSHSLFLVMSHVKPEVHFWSWDSQFLWCIRKTRGGTTFLPVRPWSIKKLSRGPDVTSTEFGKAVFGGRPFLLVFCAHTLPSLPSLTPLSSASCPPADLWLLSGPRGDVRPRWASLQCCMEDTRLSWPPISVKKGNMRLPPHFSQCAGGFRGLS